MDPEAEVPTERDPSQPDLAKICRLCLAEELGTVRIFNANENTNIPLQIMACAALEVSEGAEWAISSAVQVN